MKYPRLQFISLEGYKESHCDQIIAACETGIKWVQLRVKDKSEKEYLAIAEKAKEICDKFNVYLIINDNVKIAKQINASGVHLGQNDIDVKEAREILGADKIIGGTANTVKQIEELHKFADYVGLGPFRFTETKKNLSPLLGLKLYRDVMLKLKRKKINIPVYAIGGIKLEDIENIMKTGIYGIAVSSLIAKSENKKIVIEHINKSI